MMNLTKVLCLDLDGTVRRSKSGKTFIEGPDDVELIPGVYDLIWKYYNEDWKVIGISNQAGIAHGFKTTETVDAEMAITTYKLRNEICDPFLRIYYCENDPKGTVEPYTFRSLCRKPDIGLLVKAELFLIKREIYPDWDNSLFVGDRPEDEECAKRAGIPFMHIDEFLKQPI